MRADLFNQVAEIRDITNAIILTHNIDFVFLQSVAMSFLRRCGDPTLTILADADCAATSYRAQRELLDGMGTRYRVVPIRMHPGFVFHPKAVLLSGPQQATLFIGSGNLTFGGFRQNGEVWTRYTTVEDGQTVFEEFRSYVASLLARVPLNGPVLAELDDAYDSRTKLWTGTAPAGDRALLGRAGSGGALVDELVSALGTDPVDELVICSPYFDADGEALAALRTRIPRKRGLLLHPGRGSTLTDLAWDRAGNDMTRRPCEIRHPHQIGERPSFVHAKFYAAIRGDNAVVVQGSANCTRAALLMNGPRGNAELLTVLRMSSDAFRREWLDVLPESVDSELALADDAEEEGAAPPPTLQVLAARAEDGVILAVYRPLTATIQACSIDGSDVPFTPIEPGQLHIPHFGAAPSLVLEGVFEGALVTSPPHWVDQEEQLRMTARRRRLEETIPRTLGGERWSSDQWIELLHALGEHLKYTPTRTGTTARVPRPTDEAVAAKRGYEDLFAKDFSSEKFFAHWSNEMPVGDAHDSVRKLLLRWLGIGQEETDTRTAPDAPPASATSQGEGDQPEEVPTPKPMVPIATKPELTDRMREKLRRILGDIEATVTAPAYLESRPPDLLGTDLMMISVILRFGYGRGWLSLDVFFAFTHTVWATLFLSSSKDALMGWLEWRRVTAPNPTAFTAAIASPQLSAALIAWSLVGLDAPPSIERARFKLARALSAARMPELWFNGDVHDIASELADVVRAGKVSILSEQLISFWRDSLAQGVALQALSELLENLGLEEAHQSIDASSVEAGELLWQGAAGYCITIAAGSRLGRNTIDTLKLQLGGTGKFQGSMTLPVRYVLNVKEIAEALNPLHAKSILDLIDALRTNI
jgi:hypothetical protein